MNTFVQHVAKHKMAYLVGLIALLFGLMGWAYSRGSFNNLSNLVGGTGQAFTPTRCLQYAGTLANVYHVQRGKRCVWSCSTGTTPDKASNECVCKPGLTETSRDQFGRRVCTAAPAMSFSVNLTADHPINPAIGAIEARVDDVITFTRHETAEGVTDNSWEWHWDSTKLDCAPNPTVDSPALSCTVIAADTSEVYITMHPVFVDGHTEDHGSNRIAVNVLAPVVVEPGTLSIREMSSPQASILVAGATQQMVAQYELTAAREAFEVNKLTVINDLAGNFEDNVDTFAVRSVKIGYRDQNNVDQLVTGFLVAGSATFTLTTPLYVPADSVSPLRIYADVMGSEFGQTLSGQHFRLGLRDLNTDGTLRAVGTTSAQAAYNPSITGASSVYEHIVRFTVPTVAKDGGDEALADGVRDLYRVRVTADSARDLEIKRIGFHVASMFTASSDDLTSFLIREGSTDLASSDVSIIGMPSLTSTSRIDLESPYAGSWDQVDGIDNGGGEGYAVVDFITPRSITAGSSRTFVLKATVMGASQTGEHVSTYIADDIREAFGNAATVVGGNSNFVWSDKSSTDPAHSEATTDWANGYAVPDLPTAVKTMDY